MVEFVVRGDGFEKLFEVGFQGGLVAEVAGVAGDAGLGRGVGGLEFGDGLVDAGLV